MPFSMGPTELIVVLLIALILFGAGKIGDVGGALGRSIREFRRAATEDESSKNKPAEDEGSAPKST
ncbi:MAG: twin-arginine translocase TatA/TatE family subunit [Chloroflexi bacterium]|nr:twin-arginine translocase TatA/TatE family subunit [Chloroflexota bacterium]